MPAIDTNILIRYLARDEEEQFLKVLELFAEYRDVGLVINLPVIMEAAWVLRSSYNYSKQELIKTFRQLMNTEGLVVQSDKIIQKALDEYERSNADFEDCLIELQNNSTGDSPTYTFDKKASS
ncbi:MAG: type II toxin-antitoxin system VapC family toxin [Gracilimonas sp.]|nr:type II toxin-antitoxin system VapC family toxin [Gracilimonas sp.]